MPPYISKCTFHEYTIPYTTHKSTPLKLHFYIYSIRREADNAGVTQRDTMEEEDDTDCVFWISLLRFCPAWFRQVQPPRKMVDE